MSDLKLNLCIHGEIPDPELDIFDREHTFIETVLKPLVNDFPDLRITMEHVTTKEAVDFILSHEKNVYGSITPQHLMYTRNGICFSLLRCFLRLVGWRNQASPVLSPHSQDEG